MSRPVAAEALGTALLLATVVGSGIMAERLAGGNEAIALLANSLATGAMLPVLIVIFSPFSGAHFNPAVTAVLAWRGEITARIAVIFVLAQIAGAIAGTALAHAMFELPLLIPGVKPRAGIGQWIAEAVATAGLILTILGVRRAVPAAVPYCVGLYITAAYWFTASTSFANPAVTIARTLTTSFSGIAPHDAPAFIVAQMAGALGAAALWRWFAAEGRAATASAPHRR